MAMRMSEREKMEGRLRAAQINGGAAAATPRGDGRYTVISRDGVTRYTVYAVTREYFRCDCKSGQFRENACWHSAAAFLRVTADSLAEAA
jgi:hypothetical protein